MLMHKLAKQINHEEDNFFGQAISNDDFIISTMKNELQLFCLLCVNPSKAENFLLWWITHETPFLNV
jgi:hypothetical protein